MLPFHTDFMNGTRFPENEHTTFKPKKGITLDIKLIKQVVDLMKRSELSEFEFEEEGFKLRMSRKNEEAPAQIIQTAPAVAQTAPPFPTAAAPASDASAPAEPAEETGVSIIKSPMVGTFYRAASPDSPPFTDVGKKVSSDSIVCIIEAMKVMNEIQAEMSGTVVEALVENGEAVEYGQPLFKVKTA
jgi:acetyl-CoA carboxylase biotin carboxyl carrier protein